MEFKKSPDDTKEESPSQENIFDLQSMKRDVESLEDFEDIIKDESSMKDVTAQFLQYEKNAPFSDPSEDSLDTASKVPVRDSEESFNDFLGFGETDPQIKKSEDEFTDYLSKEQSTEKPTSNTVDEDKLIDFFNNDEISTLSDDLSNMPKGESGLFYSNVERDISETPLTEFISNETPDSTMNSQVLSKFTSEAEVNKEEQLENLLGDGLHVKGSNDVEESDNDEIVPEPIPKDYPEIGALEGKQFLDAIGIGAWIQPCLKNPKVESLVYWRDPKKSGIVFGSILIVLLSLTTFSLISVIAYTSLIVLHAALAFRIYKNVLQAVQKTSEGHPFKEYLEIDLTLSPDKAREISDVVVSHINKALTEFRRLFLVEDVIDSIKFACILWFLTYVGSWFNGLSLLIIAFVGLFTLPKVYENNKTQIDANIDLVKTKINEVTEKITAVIPMGKKTEEVKDKGE